MTDYTCESECDTSLGQLPVWWQIGLEFRIAIGNWRHDPGENKDAFKEGKYIVCIRIINSENTGWGQIVCRYSSERHFGGYWYQQS